MAELEMKPTYKNNMPQENNALTLEKSESTLITYGYRGIGRVARTSKKSVNTTGRKGKALRRSWVLVPRNVPPPKPPNSTLSAESLEPKLIMGVLGSEDASLCKIPLDPLEQPSPEPPDSDRPAMAFSRQELPPKLPDLDAFMDEVRDRQAMGYFQIKLSSELRDAVAITKMRPSLGLQPLKLCGAHVSSEDREKRSKVREGARYVSLLSSLMSLGLMDLGQVRIEGFQNFTNGTPNLSCTSPTKNSDQLLHGLVPKLRSPIHAQLHFIFVWDDNACYWADLSHLDNM